MDDLRQVLRDHLARRPLMEPRDMVKLIYQNEFGGGHLISEPAAALAYLEEEMSSAEPSDAETAEYIGNGLCRLDLSSLRGRLRAETLCAMFVATANTVSGSMEGFLRKLSLLEGLPLASGDYLDGYLAGGNDPGSLLVSHSDAYRAAYKPAYRVVSSLYADYLEAFTAVDRLLAASDSPVVIAIDGRCASGKSTLGGLLEGVYDCNLFHMDDFFLPGEKRTPQRLGEPGGNVDRERFQEEVLEPLSRGDTVSYGVFDCGVMSVTKKVTVPPKRLNIVEGVYSTHPDLSGYYDLKIFMDIGPQAQLARLSDREDAEQLAAFKERWIPMEERYFASFKTAEACHLRIFSGTSEP